MDQITPVQTPYSIARDDFSSFLTRKILSEETKKLYVMYFRKMLYIMEAVERTELDQDIVNAFIDTYPNIVSRAFLRNYLEHCGRTDLIIQKRTGTSPHKEIQQISDDELKRIRKKLYDRDERFGFIFDLSENCALRRQEVINIKGGDVSIKGTDDPKMFIIIKKAKGNKEREVFVPNETSARLLEFMSRKGLKTGSYLFRSNANPQRPMDKTQWNKAFAKASLEATGKKYHPHQLRHHRSLSWFDKGIDIVRIQQRLGHSNIATTRLYINPDKINEMKKWSKEID
jgi:integrase